MDKYDKLLVAALMENGRASFAELARRVNLSPPAVADRVAKLEAGGVITGYRASVDPAKIGLPIECLIELRIIDRDANRTIQALADLPQLSLCHRITGDACVSMRAAVASMQELEELLDRLSKYGATKTSLILSTPFQQRVPASLQVANGKGEAPPESAAGRARRN